MLEVHPHESPIWFTRPPAQEEKDKALQRATRVANHSLAVTLSGGGLEMETGMESVRLDDVKICEN